MESNTIQLSYISFYVFKTQETSRKKGQQDCQSQNTQKLTVKQSVIEMVSKTSQNKSKTNGHVNVEVIFLHGQKKLQATFNY